MAFSFRPLIRPRVLVPLLLAIAGAVGWRVYAARTKAPAVSYVTAPVRLGNLVVSAQGSGQVASSDSVDVKPTASGTITSVPVKEGQAVRAGQILVQLDASSALRAVRDAQANLTSAQIALQKLQQPPDALSLLQAQNAVTQAQQSKLDAQNNLSKAYDDAYNAVAAAFLDLPDVMTGMDTVMTGTSSDTGQAFIDVYGDSISGLTPAIDAQDLSFKDSALASYATASQAYKTNVADYKNSSRYESADQIETLLNETYATTKSIAESVKDAKNFLDYVNQTLTYYNKKLPSTLSGDEANLQASTGTTNTQLGDLLSSVDAITNDQQAITDAEQSIGEKQTALQQLQAGANALDVQSQQLSIQQKQNALADAQASLADDTVRAPFDGVVANLTAKAGDQTSGAVATILASQLTADVTLNEVDVVNVKVGQTAALTFDALPNVRQAGTVAQVDPLGTVTQGVVTYPVAIVIQNPDPQIRPGMNVSAAIATNERDNVVVVPSSAVQANHGGSFVQELDAKGKPQSVPVQTGLTNDTQTEITSGLKAGDVIVIRTVAAATAAPTAGGAGPGAGGAFFRAGGGNFGGGFRGGAVRIGG